MRVPPSKPTSTNEPGGTRCRACIKRLSAEGLVRLLQLVEPEQRQPSVLKPHVQRQVLGMAPPPPVLYNAAHPAEPRLPVPFLHPNRQARTCLVRLQEVLSYLQD